MARINIEDSLFKDIRFDELKMKLGSVDTALGAMVRAWSLAQKWYLKEETSRLIPLSEWKKQRISDSIIEVGLAEIRENGVYVAGSEAQFAWLIQRQIAGKKGGRPSNQNKDTLAKGPDKVPVPAESGSNPLSLSLSLPLSLNSNTNSNSKKEFEKKIEKIYSENYPLKKGKSQGIKKLLSEIKTEDDLSQLNLAVVRYAKDCAARKTDPKYIKHFSTFATSWRDWLDDDVGKSTVSLKNYENERDVDHDAQVAKMWGEL